MKMFRSLLSLFEAKYFTNEDGYIQINPWFQKPKYIHREVAEKVLQRKLRFGEEVHHIDRNRANNTAGNLCVMTHHAHKHFHKWLVWMRENRPEKVGRLQQLRKLRALNGILLQDVIIRPKDNNQNYQKRAVGFSSRRQVKATTGLIIKINF